MQTENDLGSGIAPSGHDGKTGINSIEVGVPLLKILAESVNDLTLTALAKSAGMTTSKAHKYLVSFIRVGLVRQSGSTGYYSLGPFACEMAFAALRRLDVTELSQRALEELRDRLRMTTSLAIWGNYGPIIVRHVEIRQVIPAWSQLGTTMPLLTSASGRVFAAYLDRKLTRKIIQAELNLKDGPAAHAGLHTMKDVDAILAEVRRIGVAPVVDILHVGVTSIGAPVIDQNNYIVGALAVVGTTGKVDPSPSGKPATTLRAVTHELSRQLGARVPNYS